MTIEILRVPKVHHMCKLPTYTDCFDCGSFLRSYPEGAVIRCNDCGKRYKLVFIYPSSFGYSPGRYAWRRRRLPWPRRKGV